MKKAECSSCGAEIVWAETISRQRAPYNAAPDPKGNTVLLERPDGVVVARVFPPSGRGGLTLYLSHFASCRDAAAWRGKKREQTLKVDR